MRFSTHTENYRQTVRPKQPKIEAYCHISRLAALSGGLNFGAMVGVDVRRGIGWRFMPLPLPVGYPPGQVVSRFRWGYCASLHPVVLPCDGVPLLYIE